MSVVRWTTIKDGVLLKEMELKLMNETEPAAGRKAKKVSEPKKPRAPRKKSDPKPSATIMAALDLLASGKAVSVADAARQLGRSREHISRQIQKPHVKQWMMGNLKLEVALSAGRAWTVKRSLLDATSEHVRSDVSSELLALVGVQAPRPAATNVLIQNNNGGQSHGYILNLSGWAEEDVTGGIERGELEFRHGAVIDPRRTATEARRALTYTDAVEMPPPSRV